jgi:hypothetical protein
VSDIANAIYKHLRTMAPHQLERLTAIQLKEAADEIARLRLTDEEREDLQMWVAECMRQCSNATDGNDWDAAERWSGKAVRAAQMLERLK